MPLTNAERQAAWRERRRLAGQTTHPERKRRRAQGRPARPERQQAAKPWLMIDTEGADDHQGVHGDPGRQWTFLICAASDDGFARQLYTGRPLTSAQMIQFLVGLPREYRIGGYYLGYDYSQLLHQLPEDRLRRLLGSGEPAGPAAWDRWVLALFHTQLRIVQPRMRPVQDPDDIRKIKGTTRVVWDVGRFYAARLTSALEQWSIPTEDEQRFLERMKASRRDFSLERWQSDSAEIIAYSLLENRLTARLQTQFDATMIDLGYPLTSWYGAGSVAKAMLKGHGIAEHLERRAPIHRPKRGPVMLEHLADAYFGGRFEIQRSGRFAPVHEYDLRSAYAASYRQLPCLMHGRWTLARDREQIGPHDFCLVDWWLAPAHLWGPFPHRQRDGSICYPDAGVEHAVWGEELIAARALWGDAIRVTHRWRYRTSCDCQMFNWVDAVYARRVALGKDTKGFPLRLGLSAMYGTFASALGAAYQDGQLAGWCEPRWAAMITAWTRARLLDALGHAGGPESDQVIMFATDAIYATAPLPQLDLTNRLGGWEHHEFPDGGLLIQPGLYHLRGQDLVSKLKGRGIAYADLQQRIGAFYDAYDRHGTDGQVTLELSPRYVGARLALARNNLASAWRWAPTERTIRLTPSGKRELISANGHQTWGPRRAAGLTGPAPHPVFALLLMGVDVGVPTVPEDARIEAISAGEQPEGPAAL